MKFNQNIASYRNTIDHKIRHGRTRRTGFVLLAILMSILTACEPEATPIAVALTPTVTPIPVATVAPPIRYALTQNTLGFVRDIEEIEQVALVEQLTDDGNSEVTQNSYDIIATFGLLEGWLVAPDTYRVGIALNTTLTPLNNPMIRDLIKASLQPEQIAEASGIIGVTAIANPMQASATMIRNTLANAGFPDGFALRITGDTLPTQDILQSQLQSSNFDVDYIDDTATNTAHIVYLLSGDQDDWAMWQEQYGQDNIIVLYEIPVSYVVNADIEIDFARHGFPIPIKER